MASEPIIYKYPLDLTGVNPNNLVVGEPHTLPAGNNRAVVPNYGAFFAQHLVVRDADTGQALTPHDDYVAAQLYQEATSVADQEICTIVVVTSSLVSDNIEIDYQAIGGDYTYSVLSLRRMIDDIDIDDRTVHWGNVLGTPEEFPPAPHLHDVGDTYGFEYLVEGLEKIYFALLVGDENDHDVIRTDLARLEAYITQEVQGVVQRFEDHINNRNNPHGINKEKVNLELVENFPVASVAEALSLSLANRYMTPGLMGEVLTAHANSGEHDDRYFTKTQADARFVKRSEHANITLDGPKSVTLGQDHQYQITNYDSFSNYSVSAPAGTITRQDDMFTLTMPASTTVGSTMDIRIVRNDIPKTFTVQVV